jgi:uncharacterized protein with PIN domain
VKFVLDNTVGRLARLLRMAGFDTAYVVEDDLHRVVALSRTEGRQIVSRNSRYQGRVLAADFYHVASDLAEMQILELLLDLELPLEPRCYFSRCLECNEVLHEKAKGEVAGKVWPYVWSTQEKFFYCPNCERLYWNATHVEAMQSKLLEISAELDRRRSREK